MKISYRPEIDGLRAVAVLAVIFYHANIIIYDQQPFKGGFIGVDIFFVISGYLISSIILKELSKTKNFSYLKFYERRIRRIIPPLLFVILVFMPFAWLYLLPDSFIDFSKSILYSLSFGSNYYFHFSGQEYAAESAQFKPFLHTWSLAVEEQYYILFPIILIFLFRYLKINLGKLLIVLFFVSLLFSDWSSKNYPSQTFYFIHTRIWELLAGSIMAYYEMKFGHRSKNQLLNLILPTLGFLLIILSIIFFKTYFRHPSFYTLVPVVGVCLIIWFSNKNEIIYNILSSKILVAIGLISYSLYLWHYPIFVFDRITEFSKDNSFNTILVWCSLLLLSIISYFIIERPSRNNKIKFSYIFGVIFITYFSLLFSNLLVLSNNGYSSRAPEILNRNLSMEKPWNLLTDSKNNKCLDNIERCSFNTLSNKNVYLVGDSHMASIMFDLKDKIVDKNYQFITSVVNGCIYFPGFDLVTVNTTKADNLCNNQYFLNLEKEINNQEDSIIIFGGRFPFYLNDYYYFDNKEGGIENNGKKWNKKFVKKSNYKSIEESFKTSILELSKKNKIILIYPIPEVGWDPFKKINLSWVKSDKSEAKFDFKNITTSYDVYKKRSNSTFELFDSIQNNNIYRVYPNKILCNTLIKNRCITHDDKDIFYIDDDHLSLSGSKMLNDLVIKELEKIELYGK
ncbi:acyltransferase [Candidatus Pelagibacter sp.]|nr:acyltransferase [Candidatus Pelagibacter sp.]